MTMQMAMTATHSMQKTKMRMQSTKTMNSTIPSPPILNPLNPNRTIQLTQTTPSIQMAKIPMTMTLTD